MRLVPTIVAVIASVTFGIVIVMQKLQLTELGYQLGEAEREYVRLSEELRRLDAEVARMGSLEHVSRRVEELGLALQPPGNSGS